MNFKCLLGHSWTPEIVQGSIIVDHEICEKCGLRKEVASYLIGVQKGILATISSLSTAPHNGIGGPVDPTIKNQLAANAAIKKSKNWPGHSSPLSAGVSLNQAAINEGIAQGMPDRRIISIKASSRVVWLDADGNVTMESDEVTPSGLTDAERGQV